MSIYDIICNICELVYEKYNMGRIKSVLSLSPLRNGWNMYWIWKINRVYVKVHTVKCILYTFINVIFNFSWRKSEEGVSHASSTSSADDASVIGALLPPGFLFLIHSMRELREMSLSFLSSENFIFSALENCNWGLFLWLIWLLICQWLDIISVYFTFYWFLKWSVQYCSWESSKVEGRESKQAPNGKAKWKPPQWPLKSISIDTDIATEWTSWAQALFCCQDSNQVLLPNFSHSVCCLPTEPHL